MGHAFVVRSSAVKGHGATHREQGHREQAEHCAHPHAEGGAARQQCARLTGEAISRAISTGEVSRALVAGEGRAELTDTVSRRVKIVTGDSTVRSERDGVV